jgi:hypothetical protein
MFNGRADLGVAVRATLPAGMYVIAGTPLHCAPPKRRVTKAAAAAAV